MINDALDPVVAAVASAPADARHADVEIDVVKQNEDFFRRDLVEMRSSLNGDAGGVHICQRLHEKQPLAAKVRLRGERLEALPGNLDLQARGQQVKGHKTGIVTGFLVLGTRIAEPRDQPVIGGRSKQHKNQNRTDIEFSS